MTSVTCKSHVFPNIVTYGVPASRSRAICGSSETFTLARRVEPNAAIFACFKRRFLACSKNAMSRGLEPGHPPSMKSIPKLSIFSASLSFAATERDMPSHWVPSLNVVSYIKIFFIF